MRTSNFRLVWQWDEIDEILSWLYRVRPSVAHQGFTKLPDNPDVCVQFHMSPIYR